MTFLVLLLTRLHNRLCFPHRDNFFNLKYPLNLLPTKHHHVQRPGNPIWSNFPRGYSNIKSDKTNLDYHVGTQQKAGKSYVYTDRKKLEAEAIRDPIPQFHLNVFRRSHENWKTRIIQLSYQSIKYLRIADTSSGRKRESRCGDSQHR